MLRESQTAVVARNETWEGHAATEPYEAGWALEAVVFVRALADPAGGEPGLARVEFSPDGMRWLPEGTTFPMPRTRDETTVARVRHFGNWLRVATDLAPGVSIKVLVTFQLK
jgi:hypothetical protein